jgi:nitrite reductase (NADH) large subunit
VVIGGGLLGLEAANALKQLGLETHVVEFAPNLMAVQLDNDGAAMLRKKIEALGVVCIPAKRRRKSPRRTAGWCCALPMANSWKPTWWSSLRGFVRRMRWRAAAGWLSANAAGSALTTAARPPIRTCWPSVNAPCGRENLGLVAPGYQMARVAAAAGGRGETFAGADMSTKLKLLGVDVASFGDAHGRTPGALSYQWTHGPQQIYKKIVVSHDSKTLLGGVLVGDASEYATLVQMMLNGISLPKEPETLILPASSGSAPKALGVAALPESAQICSCHNVSKGDICQAVSAGATDIGAIKQCTKAATGCGGCSALVKQVMEFQLAEQGVEVKKTSANTSRTRARRFTTWCASTISAPLTS